MAEQIIEPTVSLDQLSDLVNNRQPTTRRFVLRPGAVYRGGLALLKGDPDNPVEVCGQDPDNPAVLRPTPGSGIYGTGCGAYASGAGGWYFRNLRVVGDDLPAESDCNGIELGNGQAPELPSRGYVLENVEVSGFSRAGVAVETFAAPVSGVTLKNVRSHHNANGFHLGGGPGGPLLRLRVEDCEAWENWLRWGFELNAASGTLYRIRSLRNGAKGSSAAGLIAMDCKGLLVEDGYSEGNIDPAATGDGQGFVFNDCTDSTLRGCLSVANGNGGYSLRGDRPGGVTSRCLIDRCTDVGSNVGLHLHDRVWNCEVRHSQLWAAGYKSLDLSVSVGLEEVDTLRDVRIHSNLFEAPTGRFMECVDLRRLGGLRLLPANDWRTRKKPLWLVEEHPYTSLAEALAAVPVKT